MIMGGGFLVLALITYFVIEVQETSVTNQDVAEEEVEQISSKEETSLSEKPSLKKKNESLTEPLTTDVSIDNKSTNPDEIIEKDVSFSDQEPSPFDPDIVILTKNLSDLPSDLVKNSFLGKVITKETMFYYEDDPQYLGVLGTLRRLSFEHNIELKDSVIKYILAMPGELALWRGADGKLKDFLFISDEKSLNNIIVDFYLKFKHLRSDDNIRTFSYGGQEGYYLKIANKELAILGYGSKLYITSLHPKYFPNNLEDKLKRNISETVGADLGKGFYKRLFNIDFKGKHSIILNTNYLTFGYSYFIPSLKAIRLDFHAKEWSVHSFMSNNEKLKTVSSAELWKVFPKSTAMCSALPVDNKKIFKILTNYKELTLKRINGQKAIPADGLSADDSASGDIINKSVDLKNQLLSEKEIEELANHVIGVCWYERSTIYTPLFITKGKKLNKMKGKFHFLFEQFVGGVEREHKVSEVEMNEENGVTVYSRVVSSQYGVEDANQLQRKKLKFNKFFKAKLAHNNEYIIFSPDGKLVDLAISTLSKKSPSVFDELKLSNKNISYLLSPYRLSQLLDKYMKKALPHRQESVFRNAIKKHLSEAFSNLSQLKSFGVDMPKLNEEDFIRWQKLKIHEL